QATPTQAVLSVGFSGLGSSAYAATTNLSSELMQANATLSKYVNGNVSEIQTSYYNLYNQSDYPYTSYNGYVAMESLTVIIPNVDNVSAALGALSAINGVSIEGSSSQLSDSQFSSLRGTALS